MSFYTLNGSAPAYLKPILVLNGTNILLNPYSGATIAKNLSVINLDLGWANLSKYPTACPAGSFLTGLGDSTTCTTPTLSNFQIANVSNTTKVANINDHGLLTKVANEFNRVNLTDFFGSTTINATIKKALINNTPTNFSNVIIGLPTINAKESTLEVYGNVTINQTNNTIGNMIVFDFNSSCAGFRFKTNGGIILSCAP